jgi:predicted ATPase/class 3 adenylate cyclase
MTVEFAVLGPFEVRTAGKRVEIGGARRRALLAYLLVNAGVPHPVDRIVDALWSGAGSGGSPATVRTYLSHFRRLLAGDPEVRIEHGPAGYLLDLPAGSLDASRFTVSIAAATSEPDPSRRVALLQDAAALWRGPPLDEFAGETWADEPARQWTQMHVRAQEMLGEALLRSGRHQDARDLLESLVVSHPLHEQFWGQLIVARYRCGQQTEALAAARDARRILAHELGIDPGPALIELERQVLAQDPALAAPSGVTPLDTTPPMTVIDPWPRGVVTFLLTDIESSTQLWDEHPDDMARALARHEDVIREVVEEHAGRLLKTRGEGDATMSVFERATDAARAAVALQRRVRREAWPNALVLRTRVALHTGEAQLRDGDYFGGTLNRAARIRALASGDEIVMSRATHDLVVDTLPEGVALADLGTRGLRGLKREETVYLVRAPDLPARSEQPPTIARPRSERTGLIGRDDDIERVVEVLDRPGMATICGPGGIGKTRLLQEIYDRTLGDERFARTWCVELVGASGTTGVESALHEAVSEENPSPISPAAAAAPRDLADRLATMLGERRGLLALDNCEHLVDALAPVVESLMSRCPTLSVLATSRQPLGVRGERVVVLAPLPVPETGASVTPPELEGVESVRLLIERTRDAGGDLSITAANVAPLAELCRQLDGIPLALELAAARLRSTSAQDLVARMQGRLDLLRVPRGDARHRTMRDAIEWSYQLLSGPEKMLLDRLSVFVGGFTLDAAEEVCVDDEMLSTTDAVYLNLAELVSKSFVIFDRDAERYRLLEPIRQFARGQLDTAGETPAALQRHARWILQASRAVLAPQLTGRTAVAAAFRLELDNVHAALAYCETADHGTYMRIVAALGYTWFERDWRRGRAAADVALTFADEAPPRLHAAVLLSRGITEQRNGYAASVPWLEHARSLYTELDDPIGLAWATFFLGRGMFLTDSAASNALLLEALALFRSLEFGIGEAWCLINVGAEAAANGNYEDARKYYEATIDVLTEFDDETLRGIAIGELGRVVFEAGDEERAAALLREAIELQRSAGENFNLTNQLLNAAWIDVTQRHFASAQQLFSEAIGASLRSGDDYQLRMSLLGLAHLYAEEGDPNTARRLAAATGWDLDPPTHRTRSLLGLALAALQPILEDFEDDARAGRAAGLVATARAAQTTTEANL